MTKSKTASTKAGKPRQRAIGAGVKPPDGVTETVRKNVVIDASTTNVMLRIGAGNLSLGVREAARRLEEQGDTEEFSEARHQDRTQ